MRGGVRAATVAAAVAAVAAAGSAVAISTAGTASAAPSTWTASRVQTSRRRTAACDRTDRLVEAERTAHPGRLALALARRKATDPAARIGTTLCGRGGPGTSGVALIKQGEMNGPGLL